MAGTPKRTPLLLDIDPVQLPADLRERARLCRRIYRPGAQFDAQYMDAAAAEIERLRTEIGRLYDVLRTTR